MDNLSNFYEWVCKSEEKSLINSDGSLTKDGDNFVKTLEKSPNMVLSEIRHQLRDKIFIYVAETNKPLMINDGEGACKNILEKFKERFLKK